MVSTFVLLLTTLIVIGALKMIFALHHVYCYCKNKGLPYMPNSLSSLIMSWKWLLGYMSFADYCQYIYYYFPNAKYIGTIGFSTPAIILRDPELIKDILVTDFEHFRDHYGFNDISVEPLWSKNLFNLRGNRWREMRNTMTPSFTPSKMRFMYDLMSKCAHDYVDYFVEHPELCHSIETKDAFGRYTADVIAAAVFGISVNSMEDRNNEFYIRGTEAVKYTSGLLMVAKLVFLRMCPWFFKSTGLTILPSVTRKFYKKVIGETIRAREKHNIVRRDMIHLLMQARDKDSVSAPKMTLDDIVSHTFMFFVSGYETTAFLICFVAHELALNRDVQDRLREEIQRYLAEGNGEISYDSLSKMSYMDMVISETLRKHPAVAFLDRVCIKKYELPPSQPGYKNVIVEPNNVVLFPIYALHHDPKYFPNPDKFDPERFSEKNKDNILPCTYLPFGDGPRKCTGYLFAFLKAKVLLAHLLPKFTLKAIEKTIEPFVYTKNDFVLQPVGGIWIGLEKRET